MSVRERAHPPLRRQQCSTEYYSKARLRCRLHNAFLHGTTLPLNYTKLRITIAGTPRPWPRRQTCRLPRSQTRCADAKEKRRESAVRPQEDNAVPGVAALLLRGRLHCPFRAPTSSSLEEKHATPEH